MIQAIVVAPYPLLRAIDFMVPEQNCAPVSGSGREVDSSQTFGSFLVMTTSADSARVGTMATLCFTLEVEDVISIAVIAREEPIPDS